MGVSKKKNYDLHLWEHLNPHTRFYALRTTFLRPPSSLNRPNECGLTAKLGQPSFPKPTLDAVWEFKDKVLWDMSAQLLGLNQFGQVQIKNLSFKTDPWYRDWYFELPPLEHCLQPAPLASGFFMAVSVVPLLEAFTQLSTKLFVGISSGLLADLNHLDLNLLKGLIYDFLLQTGFYESYRLYYDVIYVGRNLTYWGLIMCQKHIWILWQLAYFYFLVCHLRTFTSKPLTRRNLLFFISYLIIGGLAWTGRL